MSLSHTHIYIGFSIKQPNNFTKNMQQKQTKCKYECTIRVIP